jgi:WD repeat-containing protein 42A
VLVVDYCDMVNQVRHSQILEDGTVETKKLAKHRGRAHKLAIEPGSSRIFFSCAEDGVVRHVSHLLDTKVLI